MSFAAVWEYREPAIRKFGRAIPYYLSQPILKSRIREAIREDTVTLAHVFGSEENAGDSTPCPRYTYMMAPNMT